MRVRPQSARCRRTLIIRVFLPVLVLGIAFLCVPGKTNQFTLRYRSPRHTSRIYKLGEKRSEKRATECRVVRWAEDPAHAGNAPASHPPFVTGIQPLPALYLGEKQLRSPPSCLS